MDLQEIGVFQFENLVRNKIPFTFLNLGISVEGRFPSHLEEYLKQQTHQVKSTNAVEYIQTLKLSKDFAIIIAATQTEDAKNCARALERNGFANVYYVGEVF